MKLVASMNVHNEMGRYLELTINHLASYCDEIRVQDDNSDDGGYQFLKKHPKVSVHRNDGMKWVENEGELHQQLFNWTIKAKPTHILAIDADEIVPEGEEIRAILESSQDVRAHTLRMCEIWHTDTEPWQVRWDGGWIPHEVAILYAVPPNLPKKRGEWDIWGRKMAGGRTPRAIRTDHHQGLSQRTGLDILHLGWSRPEEREARHRRYVELDGGNFHAGSHLDSIMYSDDQCDLRPYEHELDKDLREDITAWQPAAA